MRQKSSLEEKVRELFKENKLPYEWSVFDGEVYVSVNWGDWKHDHRYLEYVMEQNNFKCVSSLVTEEDGSDCYSADYTFVSTTPTYVDGCGFMELEIPSELVTKGFHSGKCDKDIEELTEHPIVREQLDRYTDEDIVKSLCEVWDDSSEIMNADRATNEKRAVWIACGNIIDEENDPH